MKYFFYAVAFFALGYVIPTFSPFLQILVPVAVILMLAAFVYFIVEARLGDLMG